VIAVRRTCGVALLAALSGCGYRVELESLPEGATVELPDGELVSTPDTVRFVWRPFGKQIVRVSAPGYRTLELDMVRPAGEVTLWRVFRARVLRPWTSLTPRRAVGRVQFVLTPEHGPAGTWTPEGQGLTD